MQSTPALLASVIAVVSACADSGSTSPAGNEQGSNEEPTEMVTVGGEFAFARVPASVAEATAFVTLEDVTFTDAASEAVTTLAITEFDPAGRTPFQLDALVAPTHSYSVRVFVDLDGNTDVSVGDHISKESFPVATFGYPLFVEIVVKPVE